MIQRMITVLIVGLAFPLTAVGGEKLRVNITPDLATVTVTHSGKSITIKRNQLKDNSVPAVFAKTSRPCPPFCIQPATLAPGIETVGELEVLDYLQQISAGDDDILVIDSRTPDWVERGTIPGSINIPWTRLSVSGSDPLTVADILENQFGAMPLEGLWDFTNAKTLILFCNGMWCGQSPNNIKSLLRIGYPAHRIKWYRGGMQDWSILGLTTVTPD